MHYGKKSLASGLAFALILTLLEVLSACSTPVRVSVRKDRATDFSRLNTFAWIPKEHGGVLFAGLPVNIDVRNRIRAAIEAEMLAKGYVKAGEGAENGGPDLWLRPYGGVRDEEVRGGAATVPHISSDGLFEPTLDGAEPYRELSEPSGGYRSGTLVLEAIAPADRKVVWKGTASGIVNETASGGYEVERFVKELLQKFPAKQ